MTVLFTKKEMEKREIMKKKTWKYAVHSIKVNYEKGIEKNNDLKLNIDEQQDSVGDLKT